MGAADDEDVVRGHVSQPADGFPDLREAGLQPREQDGPFPRQVQRSDTALEQLNAEMGLQGADLMAQCARGDVQLLRRLGHAEVAGGGLEGPQGVQGGKRSIHENFSIVLREFILCRAYSNTLNSNSSNINE